MKTVKGELKEVNIVIENVLIPSVADFFGLASGLKSAAYLMYKEEEIDDVLLSLKTLSPEKKFKIVYAPEREWIDRFDGEQKKKHFFIGEDEAPLLKLKDAFDKEMDDVSHQEIGALLSYPKCCADRISYDIALRESYSQKSANEINFLMNNFFIKSNTNLFLYTFHPCSYYCREANNYVEKIYKWLEKIPETRKFIEEKLKMPIMYLFPSTHVNRAVSVGMAFGFDGKYKDKNTILYERVYCATKACDDISDTKEGNSILNKILDGNRISIREGGFDVYNESILIHSIDNEKVLFFWPK